ncbi:unnamed protein product [Knipowitschia caucasica]
MQVQTVCAVLLCFTCGALCSELDLDQRALTQEILSSLFSAKMRPQSAPFWRVSLSTLCRLVSEADEGRSQEVEEAELSQTGPAPLNEQLYGLRVLCQRLQEREQQLQQDSSELLDLNNVPAKRRTPYILKKRASTRSKPRRPYILKRSADY